MARKYGKINKIKVDPLAYNVAIIGESGIGKSTLMKEVCATLTDDNPDAYMILNMGQEDGVDAIVDASYEDAPDWDVFEEIIEDIVENKLNDYEDLRVVIVDTMDELFRIVEPEVIRLHNRAYPDKPVKTIKGAFGGYQAGEDKAIELVLDKVKLLKSVGVSVWFVGHTKKRTLTDVVTGLEYDMLTTNMPNKYFNAVKTKLHVLGVASIDRDITQAKTGKKDFNGKEKIKGSVNSAMRKITFRDDNFNIDSKSRFPSIIDSIGFSKEEFIEAITDAIKAEFDKQTNVGSMEEEGVKQAQEKAEKVEIVVAGQELKESVDKILKYLKDNKGDKTKLTPIALELRASGLTSASNIADIETANKIIALFV